MTLFRLSIRLAVNLAGIHAPDPGLITHIGGLNVVPEATLDLPNIPGGKKLIYTHRDMVCGGRGATFKVR